MNIISHKPKRVLPTRAELVSLWRLKQDEHGSWSRTRTLTSRCRVLHYAGTPYVFINLHFIRQGHWKPALILKQHTMKTTWTRTTPTAAEPPSITWWRRGGAQTFTDKWSQILNNNQTTSVPTSCCPIPEKQGSGENMKTKHFHGIKNTNFLLYNKKLLLL